MNQFLFSFTGRSDSTGQSDSDAFLLLITVNQKESQRNVEVVQLMCKAKMVKFKCKGRNLTVWFEEKRTCQRKTKSKMLSFL